MLWLKGWLKGWLADLGMAFRVACILRYLVVLWTPSLMAHGASTHTVDRLCSLAALEPWPGLSSSFFVKACEQECAVSRLIQYA